MGSAGSHQHVRYQLQTSPSQQSPQAEHTAEEVTAEEHVLLLKSSSKEAQCADKHVLQQTSPHQHHQQEQQQEELTACPQSLVTRVAEEPDQLQLLEEALSSLGLVAALRDHHTTTTDTDDAQERAVVTGRAGERTQAEQQQSRDGQVTSLEQHTDRRRRSQPFSWQSRNVRTKLASQQQASTTDHHCVSTYDVTHIEGFDVGKFRAANKGCPFDNYTSFAQHPR